MPAQLVAILIGQDITNAYQTSSEVSVPDYSSITIQAKCDDKGSNTTLFLQVEGTVKDANDAEEGDWAALTSEVVTDGNAVQSKYQAEFDVSSESAPFSLAPLNFPTIGIMAVRVKWKGDAAGPGGSLTVYGRPVI
jgi:hypothetical protein